MSIVHLGTIKAGVGEAGTVKIDDKLQVKSLQKDPSVTEIEFTSEVRMKERLYLEKGADVPASVLYPDPFPSIFHRRGYDVMTADGPINGKITTYNSAVNTNAYTYWTTTWNYHYMNVITPMTKTYDILNTVTHNYAVIEFPITPNEHNAFWVLDARTGWGEVCGWLVHPDTGVPIKLLNYAMSNATSASYSGALLFPGPDGEKEHPERYHDWMMFPIHRDDVNLYKTAGNTIKMAVLPGVNNVNAYLHISGLASTLNPWGITWQKGLHNGSWNPMGSTQVFTNYGAFEEGYMQSIAANQTISGFKLKIFNKENDIIVGTIRHKNNTHMGAPQWTISGTTERFYEKIAGVGRMAKWLEGMHSATSSRSFTGFILPASVVQAHVQVDTKGFEYISFDIHNRGPLVTYPHAFYTEDILP